MLENGNRVAFGLYEVDLTAGEVRKAGHRVKLQSQPFKVLAALLKKPGVVVTREELWGKKAVGDFDQSLGTAVNKIREALGDTADNPRFVETLARRGYRFIAQVSVLHGHDEETLARAAAEETQAVREDEARSLATEQTPVDAPTVGQDARRSARPGERDWRLLAIALMACGVILLSYLGAMRMWSPPVARLLRIEQLTRNGRMLPEMMTMESLPAAATDGLRIFAPVLKEGRSVLSEVDVHTGAVQSVAMPGEIVSPMLGDLSPDGSTLLLRSHLSPESEQPIWQVPASGGSALRIANVVGHHATWMPDGNGILYGVRQRFGIK